MVVIERFEEDLPRELADILTAAALLDTTEFVVFRLAYQQWFGRRPGDPVIEPYFSAYMFNEKVPPWVSHFTRRVIELDASGKLNPRQLGVSRRLPSRRMMLIGKIYTVALLVIFCLLTAIAYVPEEMSTIFRHCIVPPCY